MKSIENIIRKSGSIQWVNDEFPMIHEKDVADLIEFHGQCILLDLIDRVEKYRNLTISKDNVIELIINDINSIIAE